MLLAFSKWWSWNTQLTPYMISVAKTPPINDKRMSFVQLYGFCWFCQVENVRSLQSKGGVRRFRTYHNKVRVGVPRHIWITRVNFQKHSSSQHACWRQIGWKSVFTNTSPDSPRSPVSSATNERTEEKATVFKQVKQLPTIGRTD